MHGLVTAWLASSVLAPEMLGCAASFLSCKGVCLQVRLENAAFAGTNLGPASQACACRCRTFCPCCLGGSSREGAVRASVHAHGGGAWWVPINARCLGHAHGWRASGHGTEGQSVLSVRRGHGCSAAAAGDVGAVAGSAGPFAMACAPWPNAGKGFACPAAALAAGSAPTGAAAAECLEPHRLLGSNGQSWRVACLAATQCAADRPPGVPQPHWGELAGSCWLRRWRC